jgi:hypothetical protein
MRNAMLVATMAALLGVTSPSGRLGAVPPAGSAVRLFPDEVPGSRLPVLKERGYVMSGAVRPLLFWIGREDIGLARIVWRGNHDGARGYELLVGTDPARAPRGINRWGFISEETLGTSGSLVAIMTGSHETSYEQESTTAAHAAASGEFRTIQSRMQEGTTAWQLARLLTPQPLTVHQLAAALERMERDGVEGVRRQRPVSANVRSGFLVAVADLVDATVAAARDRQGTRRDFPGVQYVFGEQTYELRVRAVDPVVLIHAGRQTPALKTSFETRALATGAKSRFELTTGTAEETAGVPLAIEWQPRWWLKVRLRLEDPSRGPRLGPSPL